MFIIGVTGGIASGKSTFARFLGQAGLPILDADKISHQVTAPGGPAIAPIREAFGEEYLNPDQSLNRHAMARLVFQDKKALDQLSQIVHEEVFKVMGQETAKLKEEGTPALVMDVPIPVEHGFLDVVDVVVCIWADDDIRLERLYQRGHSHEEAKRRILVQMTKEEYADLSDYFILNNEGLEELKQEANNFLAEVLTSRGIKYQALS